MSDTSIYKNGRRTLSLNGPGWRRRGMGEPIMPGDYWLHGGRWYTRIDRTYIDDLGWTQVGDANVPAQSGLNNPLQTRKHPNEQPQPSHLPRWRNRQYW